MHGADRADADVAAGERAFGSLLTIVVQVDQGILCHPRGQQAGSGKSRQDEGARAAAAGLQGGHGTGQGRAG